ncbi:MAG: zinc ribbon domain-containing protein [Clostridia bacterium]|nr:zinc ribbon domain-containing protein [Clostridia bacterium]
MNCPRCGNLLPQGAQFCNVCNAPIGTVGHMAYGHQAQGVPVPPVQGYGGAQGYGQPGQEQGYPTGYQQNYAQYNPQSQPYPQEYGGYYQSQARRKDSGAFLNAVRKIPAMLWDSFRDPGAVLQGMMERKDFYTAPLVAGLALLLTFLCCMILANSILTGLGIGMLSAVSSGMGGYGLPVGAAYLESAMPVIGRLSASIGGTAVLCQLFAMAVPLAVMLIYLCAVSKARFSWELLCACFTITTLPTVAAALLALLGLLIHPVLLPFLSMLGMVVSFVFMGSLMSRVVGKPENALILPRILCICLSILFTMIFSSLVGGTMLSGISL